MHQILDITLNNVYRYTIAAFDACIQCILTHRYVLRYEILVNTFDTTCIWCAYTNVSIDAVIWNIKNKCRGSVDSHRAGGDTFSLQLLTSLLSAVLPSWSWRSLWTGTEGCNVVSRLRCPLFVCNNPAPWMRRGATSTTTLKPKTRGPRDPSIDKHGCGHNNAIKHQHEHRCLHI